MLTGFRPLWVASSCRGPRAHCVCVMRPALQCDRSYTHHTDPGAVQEVWLAPVKLHVLKMSVRRPTMSYRTAYKLPIRVIYSYFDLILEDSCHLI